MAKSIANILLEITGSSVDARRELDQVARELGDFDRIDAEAKADVETADASAKLKALKAELAALANEKVKVDVDRGLRGYLVDVREATGRLVGRFGALTKGAIALAPAIAGVGAAAVAILASLASAALAAGGLAVAFAATLPPAALLAIGAVRRFKDQADEAGTKANRLKQAAKDLADDFDRALGPAADKVFSGLADAMPGIGDALRELRPNFTDLGTAFGNFARRLGEFLTSKRSMDAFKTSIDTLTRLVQGPASDAFFALAGALRNLAQAASPVLVQFFRDIKGGLEGLENRSSDIDALRASLKNSYEDLKDWGTLAKDVGRAIKNFFSAALPDGRDLVDELGKGARKLADWLESAEGKNSVKDFLNAVIPVARSVANLLAKVAEAFLAWSELVAPVLRPIIDLLGKVFDAVADVLNKLNKLPGPLDEIAGGLLLLGGPKILSAIGALAAKLGTRLAGALRGISFGGVISGLKRLGGALGRTAASIGSRFLPALTKIGPKLLRFAGPLGIAAGLFLEFGDDIKSVGIKIADFLSGKNISVDRLREIGREAIREAQVIGEQAILAIKDGVDAFRADLIKNVDLAASKIKDFGTDFEDAGKKLTDRLASGVKDRRQAVENAARDVARGGRRTAADFANEFKNTGSDLIDRMSAGAKNREGANKNAVSGITRTARNAMADFAGEFKNTGENLIENFAKGERNKDGTAKNSAADVARAARQAMADFADEFKGTGEGHGEKFSTGLKNKENAAKTAAGDLARAAKDKIGEFDFGAAGETLGGSLASGIAQAAGAVVGAIKDLIQKARDQLPGSEPRDPRSPLRRLDLAGKAVAENVAAGITANVHTVVRAVQVDLAGAIRPQLDLVGTPTAAAPAPATVTPGIGTQNINVTTPGYPHAPPDPRVLAAQLALEARVRGGF